jgi:archaellum component FlaD/FlaE
MVTGAEEVVGHPSGATTRIEDSDMAKGRRARNRLELRRQYEALESQEPDELEDEADDELEDEDDDSDYDEDDEEENEDEEEIDEDEEWDEDEEEPVAKKKKAKAPKPAPKRQTRVERRRAMWVIFDNANKRVEAFPYNARAQAEAALARWLEEKKGHYYLNLVKEVITE